MPRPGENWFRVENHASGDQVTKVYIYDEIGYWGTSADDFVQEFKDITTPDIHLHINSPGGRIFDGIAIYNAIKAHPSTVTTIVDALGASIASVIFQAGNIRQMTRNATMMIHDGSGLAFGNAEDMRAMADILDRQSDNIADIYAQAAGGSVEEWRALMKEETWYTGQEAVDAGLADEVLKHEDKDAEEATNKWDMRFFAHSGRDEAPSPKDVRERLVATLNRAKEAPVGAPTNDDQTTPPAGTAVDDKATPPKPPAAPPAPPAAPPAVVTPPPAEATATVALGDQSFTVPAPVAQHVTSLENFRRETVEAGRKNFVASLAAGSAPKIAASQIEQLEAFALSLSPDQFETWKASWDAAPGQALLGNHGNGTSNPEGNNNARTALEDELSVCRETVENHKRSNMPQDQIENTRSYQRMQELEALLNKS